MIICSFKSLYFDEDVFRKSLARYIKKFKKKHKDYSGINTKILFFPHRLIKYYSGDIEKKMLVDESSLNNVFEPLHLVFTIRNDYLKVKSVYANIDVQNQILPSSSLSNEEIINRFFEAIASLDERLSELRKYANQYTKKISGYAFSRMFFPMFEDKKEMVVLEEKTKEKNLISLVRNVLLDVLGFNKEIHDVSEGKKIIYMPVLLLKMNDDFVILNTHGKIHENKNLNYLYNNNISYREWIDGLFLK